MVHELHGIVRSALHGSLALVGRGADPGAVHADDGHAQPHSLVMQHCGLHVARWRAWQRNGAAQGCGGVGGWVVGGELLGLERWRGLRSCRRERAELERFRCGRVEGGGEQQFEVVHERALQVCFPLQRGSGRAGCAVSLSAVLTATPAAPQPPSAERLYRDDTRPRDWTHGVGGRRHNSSFPGHPSTPAFRGVRPLPLEPPGLLADLR